MAKRELVGHAESFNNKFKIMLRNLVKRYPGDEQILRAHKRVGMVLSIDPLLIITRAGPYLYKYKDQIYKLNEGGEEFFMNLDDEIRSSAPKDKADMIDSILPKVKESVRTMPEAEKTEYKTMIIEMLDNYIEYLALSRGLKV